MRTKEFKGVRLSVEDYQCILSNLGHRGALCGKARRASLDFDHNPLVLDSVKLVV